MNKDMIDLYTDYQLSSFGQTTATGLSAMMEGSISHDAVTRFLTNSEYTSKHLWQQVKPTIRDIENEDGVLIFDDTIQAKPHTKENETNCWHYDHTTNTTVKGINLLNCLYHCEGVSLPIAFHIVTKPICYSDISTRKTKRKATITKNQLLRDMVDTACHNEVKFRYVLMDSWFTSKQTLKHIRKKDKHVIAALKSNRLIALNLQDKKQSRYQRINEIGLPDKKTMTGYLKDYPHEVVFIRQVFTNKDGSLGVLYLVCTDSQLPADKIMSLYEKRWAIEVFHKSLKQNASLAKSPAHSKRAMHNHVFLSICATVKLECLKLTTKLNHFALKAKLLVAASKAAFDELTLLRAA